MFQSCRRKFINVDIIGVLCFYALNQFASENFVWEINWENYSQGTQGK